MRLLSARLRDYRRHRDLAVEFDPCFTVIAGPNEAGKSTLVEALHRALFLPVKTGGAVLEAMKTDPYLADPEVELAFEGAGESWTLRKRFAGNRGSVSLQDSRGRSLQGEEAEERLAELIGTAAVARTRAAADQLKERWGHLWVWQGSASHNPLDLSSSAYDHDRLVERLQAGADLGVQSPLDLAVLEDIQRRWGAIYTAGGANRAPKVKAGSPLQLARAAVVEAQDELETIEDSLLQQEEAQQAVEAAAATLARIAAEQPQREQERQDLAARLARSQELQARISQEQPLLAALSRELQQQQQDRDQLAQQTQLVGTLEAEQAPRSEELDRLRQHRPELETARDGGRRQLQDLQQASRQAAEAAEAIERRLARARLQLLRQEWIGRLEAAEQLQARLDQLEKDLDQLPAIDARAVDGLRRLEQTLQAAVARAEAMAAGIEVIRAGRTVRLGDESLQAGTTRLLSEPALLLVGDDVELRLLPGGGTTAAEAQQQRQAAREALERELQRWSVTTVEDAATAERRRSDLLAERERLLEQRGQQDAAAIRRRLEALLEQIEALPGDSDTSGAAGETTAADLETRIIELEAELTTARAVREQAVASERTQQSALQQLEAELDRQSAAIAAAEQALRDGQNQLLAARTRIEAVLQRHGTAEALEAAIAELTAQRDAGQAQLAALNAELAALDPETLERLARQLDQAIATLRQQEREASEARIRAEGRLQGDGRVDLQAEREQKQAELESRVLEQERLEQEAGMLTLLRRLLEEEQNAMANQYTAPLTERIGHYLGHVFPEAPRTDLRYDARGGFQQLAWRRGHGAAFSFEVLSTGAREQFAAALRLAMAEVLAEAYDGSLPLVFDDAFANSDPERRQGVVRMLEQAAGQGLQVILLTCDPDGTQAIETARRVQLSPQQP